MQSRLLTLLSGKGYDPLWPLHNLPSLQAWYTFDDPAYLRQASNGTGAVTADGDPIGYCMDRSGNSRHVIQATADARPTWKVGIRNSRAVSRYDGADKLSYETATAVLRNVTGATAQLVLQSPTGTATHLGLHVNNGATASFARLSLDVRRTIDCEVGISARRLDADSLAFLTSGAATFTAGAWRSMAVRMQYANRQTFIYHNQNLVAQSSTLLSAGNTSDTDSLGIGLGGEVGGGSSMVPPGTEIAEAIICGVDIGLLLLRRLWYEYLKPKWGLAM